MSMLKAPRDAGSRRMGSPVPPEQQHSRVTYPCSRKAPVSKTMTRSPASGTTPETRSRMRVKMIVPGVVGLTYAGDAAKPRYPQRAGRDQPLGDAAWPCSAAFDTSMRHRRGAGTTVSFSRSSGGNGLPMKNSVRAGERDHLADNARCRELKPMLPSMRSASSMTRISTPLSSSFPALASGRKQTAGRGDQQSGACRSSFMSCSSNETPPIRSAMLSL